MTMVRMAEALVAAGTGGLGSFNVVQIEHAEAIVTGAEDAGRPTVLQVSENTIAYHGAAAPLLSACLSIAGSSKADVVVHLDHATNESLVREAVRLGVPSVMFDGSTLPHTDNLRATRDVVRWCHAQGAEVEAELGEVGGKDGVHAPGVRTDPTDARRFVDETSVDTLAVAVGSSHAMLTREVQLDLDLIAALAAAVPCPLVLHGSSGVPDEGIQAAIGHGIRKVNIATHLNQLFTRAVRETLAASPDVVDPRRYLGPARDAVADEVARLLTMMA